jgi:hypothetical protein
MLIAAWAGVEALHTLRDREAGSRCEVDLLLLRGAWQQDRASARPFCITRSPKRVCEPGFPHPTTRAPRFRWRRVCRALRTSKDSAGLPIKHSLARKLLKCWLAQVDEGSLPALKNRLRLAARQPDPARRFQRDSMLRREGRTCVLPDRVWRVIRTVCSADALKHTPP